MRKPSIAEPVTELRKVRIVECGEPLVDFLEGCPKLLLDRPRFNYRRATMLRESVASMLCKAADLLPKGYRLGVIEGWRPPYIQKRMHQFVTAMIRERHPEWSDVKLRREANKYSAPMDRRVPPPHTTGGAIDVVLVTEAGEPLDHSSPYPDNDLSSFAFQLDGLSQQALRHRTILAEALAGAGLTNYPSEYWHWSYGDQGWAYRGGHPSAIYRDVEPVGWEPDPADATDEPLTLLLAE